MPRPRLAMRKIREVLRLALGEGLSVRDVGLSLGVARSTVSDHLKRAELAGVSWPLPEGLNDDALEAWLFPPAPPATEERPQPDFKHVHKELRRKGVTLLLLWLEYKEQHPDGYQHSQFCDLYRRFKGTVDVVMRQEHRAGEKVFVDFPGQLLPIYDRKSGALRLEAELFVAVLGASSYLYAEAVASQQLAPWVTAHVHAFEFFGAAPAIVVCDNLRSGVTKANRYEPDVNATYQEMAAHYGLAVIPTRPAKPRDKAKVEAGVLLAERWILARLRNRRFYSIAEANLAIRELVELVNDRPFKKIPGSRRSLFEELDRPAMRPLPEQRYEFASWKLGRKVNIDYHVEVDFHWYSVPYRLVGQQHRRARGGGDRRSVSQGPSRGLARAQPPALRTHHRPGPHAREPSPPCAVDAGAHHLVGREDRPCHCRARQGHPRVAPPPRAGISVVPRRHPPRRPLRR